MTSDLHAWGDPDHMSRPEPERAAMSAQTGATPQQIAAARQRDAVLAVEGDRIIHRYAAALVPTTARIVEDWPAVADAIEWGLFDYLEAAIDEEEDTEQRLVMRDLFDRMRAELIGGAE